MKIVLQKNKSFYLWFIHKTNLQAFYYDNKKLLFFTKYSFCLQITLLKSQFNQYVNYNFQEMKN